MGRVAYDLSRLNVIIPTFLRDVRNMCRFRRTHMGLKGRSLSFYVFFFVLILVRRRLKIGYPTVWEEGVTDRVDSMVEFGVNHPLPSFLHLPTLEDRGINVLLINIDHAC